MTSSVMGLPCQRDDAALLTLAFDRDVTAATAVSHLERVWGSCRSELA